MKNNHDDLRQEILTNELGNQLLDMVAPIYDKSRVALWYFQSLGLLLQKDMDFMENDYIAQIFIQTATWGLKYWEDEYGITPDPSWDFEQRRQNIIATKKYKAPITPKKLADRISAVMGMPAKVVENVGTNSFEVILGELTLDYTKAKELIDRIAPAHLIYEIHVEEDEEPTSIGNYYKIFTAEMETCAVEMRYTVLTDENDIVLTDELGVILTV